MCTVITRDQVEHSQICKEPFIVYKAGRANAVGDFISMHHHYRYSPGVQDNFWMTYNDWGTVSDEIEYKYMNTIPEEDRMYVTTGGHAYMSLERMLQCDLWRDYLLAEFIVPENARYYTNGCDNIVSSALEFKQFIDSSGRTLKL